MSATAIATALSREMVATYLAGVQMWVSLHTDQPTPVDPLSTMVRSPDDDILPVTWNRDGAVLSNANDLRWTGLPSLASVRFAVISGDIACTNLLFLAELRTQDPSDIVKFRSVILSPGELRIAVV